MTDQPVGTKAFFDDLDDYRFDKLHYLPKVVDFSAFRGQRLLEVGCGIGTDLVRFAKGGARVTGIDLAQTAIDLARKNFELNGVAAEELLVANGEALPYPDASFDAVVSTFGVMFASRPESAAAEIARVVRKGGRIALTTWTNDGALFKMFNVMKKYMTTPTTPTPPSPFEWGRIDRIRQLLGGTFQLRFERSTSFYREPSAEAAWETFSRGYGPTRTLATTLDTQTREAFRNDFIAFHAMFTTELGICVARDYVLTVGVRQ